MPWYRTRGGRLIFGEGGLAAVYEDRGWERVDDAAATAESTSGEAQARADVESEVAAGVDERVLAEEQQREQEKRGVRGWLSRDTDGVGELSITTPDPSLTPAQQADVDTAVHDEGHGG